MNMCPSCGSNRLVENVAEITGGKKTDSECLDCNWSQSALFFYDLTRKSPVRARFIYV